jgi:hypothetical protein
MTDTSVPDRSGDPTAAPGPAPASRWEDFIDIFYAPAQVFARRANSGFGIPMLVVTLLIGILAIANSGVMQPIMDAEFARGTAAAMRRDPRVTAEMMEKTRGVGEAIAKYGAFVFVPVGIFISGVVLWLSGKLVDATEHLNAALMVVSYSLVPRVVEGVVTGAQGLLLDPSTLNGRFELSLGLGRFLDPDTTSPVLLALLGRVDLFSIWVTVLLAIGLSVVGRIPRSRAAIPAVLVWLFGTLPQLMIALRS